MKIALTGGMGCGKTFVLSCFKKCGWVTVETDAITRSILADDASVAAEIKIKFGEKVFDSAGKIDRKALAARVFCDETELRTLEDILHPRIQTEWENVIREAGNTPAIVEIPILFEKKLEKLFDISVCVTASRHTQIARLAQRGFGREEALARMARQLPMREKELRADFVISNNGNPELTQAQVTQLTGRIVA